MTPKLRAAITGYLDEGWAVVPIAEGKACRAKDWPTRTFAIQDFAHAVGVGVRPDHGLQIVDVDEPRLCPHAERLLPRTDRIDGRPGKSPGHFFFQAPGLTHKKFTTPTGEVLVEILSTQAALPPTPTETGPRVWSRNGAVGRVDPDGLYRSVRNTAAAGLLGLCWPAQGSRHDAALAAAGYLLTRDVHPGAVEEIVRVAALVAGDEEVEDRARAASDTAAKHEANQRMSGGPTLRDLIGTAAFERLEEWFGTESRRAARQVHLTMANTITPQPVRWLWQDRMPAGSFGLMPGREGIGKSTVAYTLAAEMTRGRLAGIHAGHPRTVIVAATEDSWAHTIVPRLMAAGADLARVGRVDVTAPDGMHTELSLPADLPALTPIVRERDVALVLLDPLISRLASKLDTHKDAEVRRALEPLIKLADDTGAVVLGLIHQNKGASRDPLNMIMGSRAFSAVARFVLFVAQDPEDDDVRLIGQPKNNLGRTDLPTLTFTIEEALVTTTADGEKIRTGRLRWTGEDDRSIHDVVRAADGNHRTAAREAAAWLTQYLQSNSGAAASADVKRKGQAAGFSERTLKRAKRETGILDQRTPTSPPTTLWLLPGTTPDLYRHAGSEGQEAAGEETTMPS